MTDQNFTATITVDQTPYEAFAAITNVRGWWSTEITGDTEHAGDTFVFEVPDVHRCTLKLTEVLPGERVVWQVSDSYLAFAENTSEWDDTEVVFDIIEKEGKTEVRFTHVGLVPADQCYEVCSDGWSSYIRSSLRSLITTGKGDPFRKSDTVDTELLKHARAKAAAA